MAPAPAKTPANVPMAESLMGLLAQASSNPDVDVNKMLALYEMHEKILAREAKAKYDEALRELNKHDLRVEKRGSGSFGVGKGGYKFAKWEDMDAVLRPLMKPLGLRFSFDTEDLPAGRTKVIGTLHHEAGHSEKASITLYPDTGPGRSPNQAMGSMTSYGKRYTAEMLVNMVREDEDDDGAAGGTSTGGTTRPPRAENKVVDVKPDEPRPFLERAEAALNGEPNGTKWLALLKRILQRVETLDDLAAIKGFKSFKETMDGEKTPATIKAIIDDEIRRTQQQLADAIMQEEPTPEQTAAAADEMAANGAATHAEVQRVSAGLEAKLADKPAEDDDTFPADRP